MNLSNPSFLPNVKESAIVTNGLVMALDAGNRKSYIGSGSAWRDLTSRTNHGILIATPTFTGSYDGILTLNGSTQYVTVTSISALSASNQTKNIWIRPTTLTAGNNKYMVDEGGNNNWMQLYAPSGQPGVRAGLNGGRYVDSITRITASIWTNICVVTTPSNGGIYVYINGVFDTGSTATLDTTVPSTINIGRYGGGGFMVNASIGVVHIYNRELSAAEVFQNYNVLKTRFM